MIECILCSILRLDLSQRILVQIATPIDIVLGNILSIDNGIVKLKSVDDETVYVNISQIVGINLNVFYETTDPKDLILKDFLCFIEKECICEDNCRCIKNPVADLLIQLKNFSIQNQQILFTLFGVQITLPAQNLALSSDEISFYYTTIVAEEEKREILTLIINDSVSDVTLVQNTDTIDTLSINNLVKIKS